MSEVTAMRYISERTNIPIPAVIDAIQAPAGQAFFIMTRMPGELLGARLKTMLAQDRSLA
jgi:hypothetical protein